MQQKTPRSSKSASEESLSDRVITRTPVKHAIAESEVNAPQGDISFGETSCAKTIDLKIPREQDLTSEDDDEIVTLKEPPLVRNSSSDEDPRPRPPLDVSHTL